MIFRGLAYSAGLLSLLVSASKVCPDLADPPASSYCISDPVRPTKIFHWTFNVSALNDTANYLLYKASAGAPIHAQMCSPYLAYLNSTVTDVQEKMIRKLEYLSGNLAGIGAYFAEDPLTSSQRYGNILVELEVPPNIKCLKYEFKNRKFSFDNWGTENYLKLVTGYVLSDAEILVYPWVTPSLVVRDFSPLMPLKIRAEKFEIPKVLEMYKLSPIFNQPLVFDDWKKLFSYYGPWISNSAGMVVALFSEDFKIYDYFSKNTFTNFTISSAIDFEFASDTLEFSLAKKALNISFASIGIYPDSFDRNNSKWILSSSIDEKLTKELLIRANYLPESARSANLTDIPLLMFDHFTAKNGTKNLFAMIDAYISIRDQIPRISTWNYITSSIQ
jgi:hypothetical protein